MPNRRDFLKGSIRTLLLGGLSLMSGTLLLRQRNSGKQCDLAFACGKCKSMISCRLPQAVEFKKKNGNNTEPKGESSGT